jgi:Zn finger protein HypA/HybF involved in hydrogenase expression
MSASSPSAPAALRCAECGAESADGRGWRAYLVVGPEHDEETEEAVVFCPECAAREFDEPLGV